MDADRFPELIARVQKVYCEAYPPHLIAVVSQYGLMTPVGDDGVHTQKNGNKIDQHHIELLLALSLSVESRRWGLDPASPQLIEEAMHLVGDLADAFHSKRFINLQFDTEQQRRNGQMLHEMVRLHTQMVRNWSHFSGVVELSKELYSRIDSTIIASHGFSATDAILILEAAVRSYERRQNDKFQRLRKVLRERSRNRIGRKLNEHFPELVGDAVAWTEALPTDWRRNEVMAAVMNLTDRLAVSNSLFDCNELAKEAGVDTSTVRRVLESLSCEVDALLGHDLEHLFLENPIWSAPFLNVGGSFYCPVPHAAFSHIHRVMRRLVDEAGAARVLSDTRAKFLEAKIADTIKNSLPTAQVHSSAKWRAAGVEYETDLIAILDQTILIVEAKSHALTAQGLRGAPKRVQRHVRELVEGPAKQSMRLQQEVQKAKSGDPSAMETMLKLGIDATNIEIVLRLSITLDDFSVISSSEFALKDAGWIGRNVSLPPTLNVADFISVCHILDEPALLLHYLSERERVQKTAITGDELDLLGLYIGTCFNKSTIADDETSLLITGMSSIIDHYYNSLDAGISVPKPKPKVHPKILQMIQASRSRNARGWTVFSTALLGIGDFKEQKWLFNALEKIRKSVRKNFRDPSHECAVVVQPPDYRDFAFVFHVYPRALSGSRNSVMNELGQSAMEEQGRRRCIVVSKMVERWDEPYDCVAMMRRFDA
ncbi:MAG: hypothetical protein ABL307_08325 [Roseitalea porphyridii]|uniref:hypothetical protein n=1 Tax=Roseitalea porphyridii TaxID=1852022 RepID=UPI0032D99131